VGSVAHDVDAHRATAIVVTEHHGERRLVVVDRVDARVHGGLRIAPTRQRPHDHVGRSRFDEIGVGGVHDDIAFGG